MTGATEAKIIPFPISHKNPHLLSKEGDERNQKGKVIYAHSLSLRLTDYILDFFPELGINIADESVQRDFSFMMDVATALIDRSLGIDNELHEYMDKFVKEVDENGDVNWVYPQDDATETIEIDEDKGVAAN
jgi:hypothetical protein